MARHSRTQSARPDEPALAVSSLIDICFLLLIFFLATTTLLPRESELRHGLPRPGSAAGDLDFVLVRIEADGAIALNSGPAREELDAADAGHGLPLLDERLGEIAATASISNNVAHVRLAVSDEAIHQRVVDVLNLLKKHHISQVGFLDDPAR